METVFQVCGSVLNPARNVCPNEQAQHEKNISIMAEIRLIFSIYYVGTVNELTSIIQLGVLKM